MEFIILFIFGGTIISTFLTNFWIEFKADFAVRWWAYILFSIFYISVPIWIYKKTHYEPKVDYSKADFSQYPVDYRSPVEQMEEIKRKAEAEKLKEKIIEKNEEVEVKPDPFEEYDKEEPEEMTINVDFDKNIYKFYSKNKKEREYLIKEGYKLVKYKSMISDKYEKYLIKPRFNESILHFYVIWEIKRFLESKKIKVDLFATKKPDLIFEFNDKTYAIEVETGSVLKRSVKQVIEKHKTMKKEYDYGFIVVPVRKMVKEYRKVVPAVDLRYLKNKLLRILKT